MFVTVEHLDWHEVNEYTHQLTKSKAEQELASNSTPSAKTLVSSAVIARPEMYTNNITTRLPPKKGNEVYACSIGIYNDIWMLLSLIFPNIDEFISERASEWVSQWVSELVSH